jgi:hypothetical protein
MASLSQLTARLVDLFGSPVTANPAKLLGNLGVPPNGNVLVGTSTDDGANKLQVAGNLAFIGNLYRITGNMSDGTWKNNLAIQSSTVNGQTNVWALPNGTSPNTQYVAVNNSDPTNCAFMGVGINSTQAFLNSAVLGTGTGLPLNISSTVNRIGFNKTASASLTNSVQSTYGLSVEAYDGNGANIRLMSSSGAANNTIFRDDGTNLYMLRSSTNYGSWTSQRPFILSHSTGHVSLQSDNSAKVMVGSTGDLGTGAIFQIYSNSSYVPFGLRNSSTATGNYWDVGPDGSNNFIIYNQASTGVWIGNGGTAWNANSDERLKNIQEPLSDAIAKVNAIRTIKYTWKKDDDHSEALGETPDSRVYVGVIAQDVQKVLPEAVTEGLNGYLGVAYSELTPLALAAIKELSAKIESLSVELQELKAQING